MSKLYKKNKNTFLVKIFFKTNLAKVLKITTLLWIYYDLFNN